MSRLGKSRGSGRGGGLPFNEGDWTCNECNNLNFARRVECNRCGEKKQPGVKKIKKGGVQIGKAAAEKSHGLFSADDWICKTCGNVNWARRSDCNMCSTPKIGVQEERTGFGGGFNERQNVEYKRREDSDDEYDQYGRLKRKKSQNGNPPKAPPQKKEDPPAVESGDNSDQDDDEDSDDGGDLSKYDLDDDDDDDDEDEDASKYDLVASDDDDDEKFGSRSGSSSSSSRSRSRSPPRKRHRSSSSSSEDSRRSSSRKRQRRSRSRSESSNSECQHRH